MTSVKARGRCCCSWMRIARLHAKVRKTWPRESCLYVHTRAEKLIFKFLPIEEKERKRMRNVFKTLEKSILKTIEQMEKKEK
jgi:hypothetical protein